MYEPAEGILAQIQIRFLQHLWPRMLSSFSVICQAARVLSISSLHRAKICYQPVWWLQSGLNECRTGCSDGYQWLNNQWLDYNYSASGWLNSCLSVTGSGQARHKAYALKTVQAHNTYTANSILQHFSIYEVQLIWNNIEKKRTKLGEHFFQSFSCMASSL